MRTIEEDTFRYSVVRMKWLFQEETGLILKWPKGVSVSSALRKDLDPSEDWDSYPCEIKASEIGK